MGVISSDGIIGIVNQVTADFSSVISILHRDLKINAGLKRMVLMDLFHGKATTLKE